MRIRPRVRTLILLSRAALFAGTLCALMMGRSSGADPSREPANPTQSGGPDERLRILHRDIETLRQGIAKLAGTEEGVLGDLKTLEADALDKQAELAAIEEQVQRTEAQEAQLESLRQAAVAHLAQLRQQIARRLNALYRLGRPRYARVLLSSETPTSFLSAYRAAAALSGRDARLIARFRSESERAEQERIRLAKLRPILAVEREARQRASAEARRALERKRSFLRTLHADRQIHQSALSELEAAERSAGEFLSDLPDSGLPAPRFDRFRGLLDWPAPGGVSAPFGRSVSKKFGATLSHSGLDIDAAFGAPIRCIQDGSVVFAQWLRGYGLTVIVDHGGGWLSVYAHASVLLAEKGKTVRRGEKIALVGDTGSLRGPYLYFEIRQNGRPVDPSVWLRPR